MEVVLFVISKGIRYYYDVEMILSHSEEPKRLFNQGGATNE